MPSNPVVKIFVTYALAIVRAAGNARSVDRDLDFSPDLFALDGAGKSEAWTKQNEDDHDPRQFAEYGDCLHRCSIAGNKKPAEGGSW